MIIPSPEISLERHTLSSPTAWGSPAAAAQAEHAVAAVDYGRATLATQEIPDPMAAARLQKAAFEAELQQARAQAEKTGYAAGLQRGEADARSSAHAGLQRLGAAAEQLAAMRDAYLSDVEDDVVQAIVVIAARCLGEHFASRAGVTALVREALTQLRDRSEVVVRMHADDIDTLESLRADSEVPMPLPQELVLRADAEVRLGGCRLETPHGTLDARLEVVLTRVIETLLATRRASARGVAP